MKDTSVTSNKNSLQKSTVLSAHQTKTMKRLAAQINPPTGKKAIRMITKLGGFLGRKVDEEPGMMYILERIGKINMTS